MRFTSNLNVCIYTHAHTHMHTLCIKVMFIWKIKLRIASHLFAHLLPDMMVHHTKFLKMLKKQHFLEFRDIRISLKYIVVIYPIHTLQSKSLTGSVAVSCDQMQWLHTLTLGRARNSFQVRFCDVFATSLWENCNFFQKKIEFRNFENDIPMCFPLSVIHFLPPRVSSVGCGLVYQCYCTYI